MPSLQSLSKGFVCTLHLTFRFFFKPLETIYTIHVSPLWLWASSFNIIYSSDAFLQRCWPDLAFKGLFILLHWELSFSKDIFNYYFPSFSVWYHSIYCWWQSLRNHLRFPLDPKKLSWMIQFFRISPFLSQDFKGVVWHKPKRWSSYLTLPLQCNLISLFTVLILGDICTFGFGPLCSILSLFSESGNPL